ncbi:MAG: hypothetical protein ACFB21_08175 [Opitutales bacterium]
MVLPISCSHELWALDYPLKLFGAELGRRVTLIRLKNKKLVVHSTAPFSAEDVDQIRALGEPAAMADATNFHDTFARQGRAAFPDVRYFAPPGFPLTRDLGAEAFEAGTDIWGDELQWHTIDGLWGLNETACLHPASRTLILADMFVNFPRATGWTRFFFRHLVFVRRWPEIDWLFRSAIRDREAFGQSVQTILSWDFDRLIPAHGDIIDTGAKPVMEERLRRYRLVP